MGGFGEKIYEYIKEYLTISYEEYREIWNTKIYPNRKLREMYNGIWIRISLKNELLGDVTRYLLDKEKTDATYGSRAIGIFLLLSCIDALSGDRYLDFYNWLEKKERRKPLYTNRSLKEFYNTYIKDHGNRRRFITLFENFIPLGLIGNYRIYFSKNYEDPKRDKEEFMRSIEKYNSSTDTEKSHIIGDYYYKLHRNFLVHSGQIIISEDTPDWVLRRENKDRSKEINAISAYPEIHLKSGEIIGDKAEHLDKLVRVILGNKIMELKL